MSNARQRQMPILLIADDIFREPFLDLDATEAAQPLPRSVRSADAYERYRANRRERIDTNPTAYWEMPPPALLGIKLPVEGLTEAERHPMVRLANLLVRAEDELAEHTKEQRRIHRMRWNEEQTATSELERRIIRLKYKTCDHTAEPERNYYGLRRVYERARRRLGLMTERQAGRRYG